MAIEFEDIIVNYLFAIGAVLAMSLACSFIKAKEFSKNVFLTSFSIGICVMIWGLLLPVYMIAIPILMIVGMLFMDRGISNE